MIKKIVLSFSVILLLSFTLTSSGFKDLVLEKLGEYSTNYPEKIYVQTDKPYYTTGEDLWFTAYLVNGINLKKSGKSRVIHVELINSKDSIISHKQLYTKDISATGDFKLDKDLDQGNYLLRAYTNYMRNDNQDYFFQKEIPVWNLAVNDSLNKVDIDLNKNNNTSTQNHLTEIPELKFYPEGGYLINGIQCKIGIKVQDKSNRDIVIEGTIKDSDGEVISAFKTFDFGLGLTSITPEPNKTYYASVLINNQETTYPLPKALPEGYQLNITNNGQEIILKASSNSSLGLMNSFLVAHQRGKLIFEKLENKDTITYTIKLNTETLQDGIANFTLFDNNGKPVCERLVYIDNPTNEIDVTVNKNVNFPKTREKVTLQIDLKDKNENQLSGNLSMAITDLDVIPQNTNEENIKTHLLLNSDLRGHVAKPGYFFEKENDSKRRFLLDVVMLTHGWRRFTWNELLYNSTKKDIYKAENGLYVSGRTTALKQKGNNISAATRLTFYGSLTQLEKQSDSNGRFTYGPFVFHDTLPTIIEARIDKFKSDAKNSRNVSIFLEKEYYKYPKVTRDSTLNSSLSDDKKITNFIDRSLSKSKIDAEFNENARLLDEVVIIAHKKSEKEKRNELLDERTDYGFPTRRLDMKDLENAGTLSLSQIMNQIPGVTYFNDTIRIRNSVPEVYLDGMRIEMTDIVNVFGNDIEFIDVLLGADAAFFSNSGNGVVAIHSRVGANIRSRNVKRKPGIIDFTSIGFYTAREFYSPDHSNEFDEVLKQDIRTTLHWEPKITLTDLEDKAEVSFYTSDSRSRYSIKIEGVTDSGIPVYHLSTFEVE